MARTKFENVTLKQWLAGFGRWTSDPPVFAGFGSPGRSVARREETAVPLTQDEAADDHRRDHASRRLVSASSSRDEWVARAPFWDRHAPEGESVTDELNRILIELAGIGPGDDVLDLASGGGEPAISIALKVGAGGSVTALDAHGEMLAGARRRAATLELNNMTFRIARMEDLPFADDTFDAVTCRFGLQSSEDSAQTLREARRVLKPGGRAGFMTHGVEERNTLSAVLANVIRDMFPERADAAKPGRLRFREQGSLRAVFDAAGFDEVGEREILRIVARDAGSRFWRSLLERRYGSWLATLDAQDRSRLDAAIEEAFAAHLVGDRYELESADMVAWGTKQEPDRAGLTRDPVPVAFSC